MSWDLSCLAFTYTTLVAMSVVTNPNLHHHQPWRHHASLPSPKCFDYACIMHLNLPTKFSMDVKSNGVAVFLMGTNIAIANQLLLTTKTIAYAGALGLCGTSSCTSFFTLWIVTQHSSKAHMMRMRANVHTNSSEMSSSVHHEQHYDKTCLDTLWSHFAMMASNGYSLLFQGFNHQWIGSHPIPICFIWKTWFQT